MYKRKYATQEERSAALSRAAKSRKNIHNCGRKRKAETLESSSSSLYVRKSDLAAFSSFARAHGMTNVQLFSRMVERICGRGDSVQ